MDSGAGAKRNVSPAPGKFGSAETDGAISILIEFHKRPFVVNFENKCSSASKDDNRGGAGLNPGGTAKENPGKSPVAALWKNRNENIGFCETVKIGKP
jgi:hypothetical protein